MSQEADEPTEVPWSQQFPFAHEYVRELVFYGPECKLGFPQEWDHPGNQQDGGGSSLAFTGPFTVAALTSSDTPLELRTNQFRLCYEAPIVYWEVDINATSGSLVKRMDYNLFRNDETYKLVLDEDYAAAVQARTDQSPESCPTGGTKSWYHDEYYSTSCFTVPVVIGCGFSYGSGAFLTKNGHLIGWHPAPLGYTCRGRAACGYLQLHQCSDTLAILRANFGQQPFAFDITGYCKSTSDRIRRLCHTLPRELLDTILTFLLLHIQDDENDYHTSFGVHCHVTDVSLVCRRWHMVTRRHLIKHLTLEKSADVQRVLALPLLWNCTYLGTDEDDAPWIHTFLASALPQHLTCAATWWWDSNGAREFCRGLPGRMSHAIPALLRRGCFTDITSLTLYESRFQSWLRFARVVLSIQQLDSLALYDVTWDEEAPLHPPRWIRFTRRIRKIEIEHYADNNTPDARDMEAAVQQSNFRLGLLCLLFAGRRATAPPAFINTPALVLLPEDISTVVSITHHVCCMSYFHALDYEQISQTRYTVSGFQWLKNHKFTLVVVFTFTQEPQKSTFQLVHISVRIGRHCEWFLQDRLFKPLTQSLLTLPSCTCDFNLRSLRGEYWLLSRVYMHRAVGDGLRLDAVACDKYYEGWEWENDEDDDNSNAVRGRRRVAIYKRDGDTVTVVWDIPRPLRDCNPQFTQSVAFYDSRSGGEKLSEVVLEPKSTMQYITAIDIGMVDVVLPQQTEQAYFKIIVTHNGRGRSSSRHAYYADRD